MTMRAVVTGSAGFIGSHLAERLLSEGHEVVGIDCMTSYYDREAKRANLSKALDYSAFRPVNVDLGLDALANHLEGCQVVFHQAAQPGVRASWSEFGTYVAHNVTATQRLLDAS